MDIIFEALGKVLFRLAAPIIATLLFATLAAILSILLTPLFLITSFFGDSYFPTLLKNYQRLSDRCESQVTRFLE